MWIVLLQFYTFKVIWIFSFIVFCVTTFIMVMCNNGTEELKKYIQSKSIRVTAECPSENRESVEDKLEVLTERLSEKERVLQRSQCEIKQAEKILNDLENKTSTCRDRYRSLMIELKKDVRQTEEEVKLLQKQVSNLSYRREALKTEVLMQQEDYKKMLNNFTKEVENKKMLFCRLIDNRRLHYTFSSSIEKSKPHHRVSCFGLP